MEPIRLSPEDLKVTSFVVETGEPSFAIANPDPFCCTGCVSGCGINPTAGGCASGGGDSADFMCPIVMY